MNTARPQDMSDVDLSKAKSMKCEKCENPTFKQTIMLHKISALISATGQETIFPAAVFACEKCNHVNEEFSKISAIAK